MTKNNSECLETMNGCEVWSINYEGCVGIKGDKVIREGEQIDTLNTDKKVRALWKELLEAEGLA